MLEQYHKILHPPLVCPPLAVVAIAAVLEISSNVSASSSLVTAEHSAYRSQRSSWAMRYVWWYSRQFLFSKIQARIVLVGTYFLWIDDILIFHPEISFQTQHYNRNLLAISMLEITCDIISPLICGLVL